jgi:hypothetical protein
MSNKDAEKEEMKDETHEVEDTEQAKQDLIMKLMKIINKNEYYLS